MSLHSFLKWFLQVLHYIYITCHTCTNVDILPVQVKLAILPPFTYLRLSPFEIVFTIPTYIKNHIRQYYKVCLNCARKLENTREEKSVICIQIFAYFVVSSFLIFKVCFLLFFLCLENFF